LADMAGPFVRPRSRLLLGVCGKVPWVPTKSIPLSLPARQRQVPVPSASPSPSRSTSLSTSTIAVSPILPAAQSPRGGNMAFDIACLAPGWYYAAWGPRMGRRRRSSRRALSALGRPLTTEQTTRELQLVVLTPPPGLAACPACGCAVDEHLGAGLLRDLGASGTALKGSVRHGMDHGQAWEVPHRQGNPLR